MSLQGSLCHYFVDEAGDGFLFARRGRVKVGEEGCSRYFILGLLESEDPDALGRDLVGLRARILKDSYFIGVPSLRPEAEKTARAFHATDDLPEVRREVFSLLQNHRLRFFAVVRNKLKVVDYVRSRNRYDPSYRYHPNELYDSLVRRLFKERLHQDDRYRIVFAKRGKANRTEVLSQSLKAARQRFWEESGKVTPAEIEVVPGFPYQYPGLQAVDYFLWALQRLYELREERFLGSLWPAFRLVHDVDDTRKAPYGAFYTQKKPLTLAALQGI